MGGDIKVVKKNGPGTVMQLYLQLNCPAEVAGHQCQFSFEEHKIRVSRTSWTKCIHEFMDSFEC